ncbi:MAG TPA: heme ABC exporter ATP-binding protein CcmA [Candidatus Dormibacteraeota bacterium]|nr:heme ABC exporter ATP-binding protein CcmA [Candidatus Dormibacteraeota bacterium]
MSAIVAEGISHWFGSEPALDAVDLVVERGDHVAVLGENGAGKTTLLRILATALRPSAGKLEIMGLDALRERRRLRGRMAYLSHAPGIYPALTAEENLAFFCDLRGADRARVPEALDLAGLTQVARKRASELSRGMQQRLAIARSVVHDPLLLILDEPDAGLDTAGADLLATVMRGRTAVLATHDQALATRLCQRTVVLRKGRVLGMGSRLRIVQ